VKKGGKEYHGGKIVDVPVVLMVPVVVDIMSVVGKLGG
jgi:hypothetical protein